MRTPTPRLLLTLALLSVGCSAGPASVDARFDPGAALVHVEISTEGKNTFTLGARACEAPKEGSCLLDVPVGELAGGWNTLVVETKRRTGMDAPPAARVYLGDAAFPRTCTADEVPSLDPDAAAVELGCTFPAGYSGELWGEPLLQGRRRIPASELVRRALPDPEAVVEGGPTPDNPLLVVDVPVTVINPAGARWERPIRVAVGAPFVQFSVTGWDDPWFDRSVPLRLHGEAGAVITIDGKRVRPDDEGAPFTLHRIVEPGANRIEVVATKPGRVPSRQVLEIQGRWPESPLYVDQPVEAELETEEPTLRIRGRSHPRAEVFLGRMPVPVRADGTFTVDAYLEEGRNDVEVSAFLKEVDENVLRRPSTRTFSVKRVKQTTIRKVAGLQNPAPAAEVEPLSIAEVAPSPWLALGEAVRFSMRADTVDQFPSEQGCRARLEGVGCGREEVRSARVAFRDIRATTCVGETHPVVVELGSCPGISAGAWVEVEGAVRGGLAGRAEDQTTLVRLRVAAERVVETPRIVSAQ